MTWLEHLLHSTEELESPQSFWYWAALAALSAVIKDNVWFDKQIYKLYPNIYVMLHADSGLKKGPPVAMAKQLVKEVNNTRIISGRSSVQAMLKEMGTAYTQPGGKILTKSVAFICSSELTSSIVEDKAAMTILTDLFDRHYNEGDWKSLLKMETFQLKDPTVTMLTATNESHSTGFFQEKDIKGGYFARTFIIYEKEANTVNSLMFPLKHPLDFKMYANELKQISMLNGPMKADIETRAYFDLWYNHFKNKIKVEGVKDPTGTLNRFDDSVLKVAMLISLSKSPELILRKDAVEEAIDKCERLIGAVRKVTVAQGSKQTYADQKVLILEELLGRDGHMITRAQLLKKYWMHFNADQLDVIMITFAQSGMIITENAGNQVVYRMPNEQVEKWKKHLEGK